MHIIPFCILCKDLLENDVAKHTLQKALLISRTANL